uniref:Uncharacterized protein n=1 Tax=Romanomermis culicivorax TaxID=13658 RepID=A0A915L5Z3_ROMCU
MKATLSVESSQLSKVLKFEILTGHGSSGGPLYLVFHTHHSDTSSHSFTRQIAFKFSANGAASSVRSGNASPNCSDAGPFLTIGAFRFPVYENFHKYVKRDVL